MHTSCRLRAKYGRVSDNLHAGADRDLLHVQKNLSNLFHFELQGIGLLNHWHVLPICLLVVLTEFIMKYIQSIPINLYSNHTKEMKTHSSW